MRATRRAGVVATALMAVLLVAGCGDDGEDATTGSTVTTAMAASSSVGTGAPTTATAPTPTATALTATPATAASDTTIGTEPTSLDDRGEQAAADATPPPTAPPPTAPPPTAPPAADPAPTARFEGPDGFVATARPIDAALAARMTPTSWRPGCPVGLEELRYLELGYIGFDGATHTGELVVHADAVDAMVTVFQRLWSARFPIHRLQLIDEFGGDDFASIEANNTSAFNCRFVAGTTRWSNHATGRAIDINPIENPYVSGGRTDHPASEPFLDRSSGAPGMLVEGGPAVAAFDEVGWGWGGRWNGDLDYQHFSAGGS